MLTAAATRICAATAVDEQCGKRCCTVQARRARGGLSGAESQVRQNFVGGEGGGEGRRSAVFRAGNVQCSARNIYSRKSELYADFSLLAPRFTALHHSSAPSRRARACTGRGCFFRHLSAAGLLLYAALFRFSARIMLHALISI